ncbi:MAG TPA: diacylglycerol kinase family protein [Steroidobacteraceae bacterium]|nr:diacylglycerol kinase family protein [Steroidobacteraceae bacterium]
MGDPVNETANTTCILNGKSVHAETARALIGRISRELGVQTRVIVTRSADEFVPLASHAVSEKRSRVAAGGGDGTVNAVAGAVAGTNTALGVLPMGTLNHFAKDAGIPLDLEDAVRNFFTGGVVKVDVGEVNGRVFVNNSGIGVYPHLVRQREAQQRRGHRKWLAFLIAVGAVLRRYTRLRVRLHLSEAEALSRLTPFVFVGNNKYEVAGLQIGRRISLTSGRLWVCTAPRASRRSLIGMAWRTLRGHVGDDELRAIDVDEFWVDAATPRINVSMDGEVSLMASPLHYRIRPGALRVVLPDHRGAPR